MPDTLPRSRISCPQAATPLGKGSPTVETAVVWHWGFVAGGWKPPSEMKKNARLAGVKNSSPSAQDIQQFRDAGGADFVVFNGPDEQLLSGLAAGATGGIGGTYGVMPELYLLIWNLFSKGEMERARKAQNEACRIIYTLLSAKGNIYAVMKAILEKRGMPIGGARKPLPKIAPEDEILVERCLEMIRTATGESAV